METARVESSNSCETPELKPPLDFEAPGFVGHANSKANSSIEEFLRNETNNVSGNGNLSPDSGQNQNGHTSSSLIVNESPDNSLSNSHPEEGTGSPSLMNNNLNPHEDVSNGRSLSIENIDASQQQEDCNGTHQESINEDTKPENNNRSPEGMSDEHPQNNVTPKTEGSNNEYDIPLTREEGKLSLIDQGLPQPEKPTSDTSQVISNQPPDSESEKPDEWLDILGSGHLMKKVLIPGTPDTRPSKSDICTISFTGCLEDGTVIDKEENLKIHLNDNEVIQGIDFALALMDKGEEAELKVGPRFAYGSLGKKPEVPSGATLLYNVKLLDVEEEPPIQSLSVNTRIALGLRKKERGNWWYSREEHSIAINCYRRALEYLDDTDIPEPRDENDVKNLLEERLKTCNNLCIAQMKIHAYDAALMSVNNVLTAQPRNVKALFRKAKILKEKGELQDSIDIIRQGLSLEPDSPSLQQELSLLLAAQRKANSKQRELYKKMLGTNSNQEKENENKKSSKSNYNALKWVTLISFAVAVIGTIAIKYKA